MYNSNNIKYTSLDQCINNSYSLFQTRSNHTTINSKNLVPLTSRKVNTSLGVPKYKKIKVLLDSGASHTIVNKHCVRKLRRKKVSTAEWSTAAGTFSTKSKTELLSFGYLNYCLLRILLHLRTYMKVKRMTMTL